MPTANPLSSELLALAAKVEALTGPDREVDALISCAVRLDAVPSWAFTWTGEWRASPDGTVTMMHSNGDAGPNFKAKAWSASIDAAMTLVGHCPAGGPDGRWAVKTDTGFYGPTATLWHECASIEHHGHTSGSHEDLPRAIVAAALRALTPTPPEDTVKSGDVT